KIPHSHVLFHCFSLSVFLPSSPHIYINTDGVEFVTAGLFNWSTASFGYAKRNFQTGQNQEVQLEIVFCSLLWAVLGKVIVTLLCRYS
ncbi:hypothetical protein CMV_025879, partial [Castanea mollissima]